MSNCPVCGTPSNPGVKFCMKCGYSFPMNQNQPGMAPMQGQPRMNQQMPYNQGYANPAAMPKPAKKKSPVVPIIIAVIAIVIVAVGAFVGVKLLLGSGYESVIKKFAKSIETGDDELYASIENPEFANIYTSLNEFSEVTGEYYLDYEADSFFEAMMMGLEDEVGDIESVEYEIKKVKEDADPSEVLDSLDVDVDEVRDTLEEYSDYFDDDVIEAIENMLDAIDAYEDMSKNCKDAVKADIKLKVVGDDDTYKETITVFVVKNDGKWTLIPCGDID